MEIRRDLTSVGPPDSGTALTIGAYAGVHLGHRQVITEVCRLAADLGTALGGGAHLRDLRRVAVGSFTVDEARPVDGLQLLSAAVGLRDLPGVIVDEATAVDVGHGKVLDRDRLAASGEGPWPVHGPDGTLIAVYEDLQGRVKPAVVLVG